MLPKEEMLYSVFVQGTIQRATKGSWVYHVLGIPVFLLFRHRLNTAHSALLIYANCESVIDHSDMTGSHYTHNRNILLMKQCKHFVPSVRLQSKLSEMSTVVGLLIHTPTSFYISSVRLPRAMQSSKHHCELQMAVTVCAITIASRFSAENVYYYDKRDTN
ncbi:hypothetical protein BDQ17DRAFT_1055024 [Cyathus striatus]|nr:hypothetical protein BDQ17DRAFT_1055024 [Cyathus striatus]